MKKLITIALVVTVLFCLFSQPVSAGLCEDVAITGTSLQDCGRLARAEIFIENRSSITVIAGIVAVVHQDRKGKIIDVDLKLVDFDLEADIFCNFYITFPLPKEAAFVDFVLTDLWTKEGLHIECLESTEK